MKIALVMLDAMIGKRAHRAGGATYALASYLGEKNPYRENMEVRMFNFNSVYSGPLNLYASSILEYNPDVIGFSAYCWNIEMVKDIADIIKRFAKDKWIVLGGPEVSYNAEELLEKNSQFDIVIRGEGELIFNDLMTKIYLKDYNFEALLGITYRNEKGEIKSNENRPLHECLDDFPSPFLNGYIDLSKSDGEVAFETVRGCQFKCSYCLHTKGLSFVRYYSFERIEKELQMILASPDINMIWFLDPTFNADEKRAIKVLKIIEKYNPNMPLAFEIRADLLTDAFIEQMGRVNVAEVGIGLQSYSEEVNKHINRKNNIESIEKKLRTLKATIARSCEQFDIDLIYGLPGDTFENYKRSVDYVIYIGGRIYYQPLRIFRGTKICDELDEYGIVVNEKAPYNVLSNHTFTLEQMISAYCLNVGIDYFNRGGIYRQIIIRLSEENKTSNSTIMETIGRFFWNKQMYEMFRISNWSPDDREDKIVFGDFVSYLEDYFDNHSQEELKVKIMDWVQNYEPVSMKESTNYSQSGYFHLTI